ncbi:hypothetical protein QTL97_14660 [Sporosarcina thermotolerans]|uniref:DUF5067 domain-containing protein n=1 Tax=Sporosarcina thermotolerans TaxID=633404 RepID=A0AAW9A964_9BACL|nr:hypothetical protein [Sporosarcina thermotolerans]MDW0118171.1 hypothetical protein [Sporosarcina thermotolerans]WHT47655.1 hypothetical protein QNH10_16200 [Sporosarcina thermotolerans]
MKSLKRVVFSVLLLALLSACSSKDITNNEGSNNTISYPQDAQVEADDFIYRLYTEKDVYSEFGDTAIFAELTYIGNQESVEISHSASPFEFPIKELSRGIEIEYAMDDPLIRTTLVKGEPLREKYRFAGGYSDNDDKETIEFIQTIINKGFPEGNYVVNGLAIFFIENADETIEPESYKLNLNIGFNVRD